jgi:hypothetical protein
LYHHRGLLLYAIWVGLREHSDSHLASDILVQHRRFDDLLRFDEFLIKPKSLRLILLRMFVGVLLDMVWRRMRCRRHLDWLVLLMESAWDIGLLLLFRMASDTPVVSAIPFLNESLKLH